jgi:serine/threonine-protein kinase
MTVPKGNVISQDPPAGTGVFEANTINVIVSSGPPLVNMPNLVGMTVDKAHQSLKNLGLKWTDNEALGGLFGIVRLQSVNAGIAIPKGTTVSLTIV